MSPQTTEQSYGVIPLWSDNGVWKALVVHAQRGHWSFPKGHAEAKESGVEAATRELFEETGIEDCAILEEIKLDEQYTFLLNEKTIHKTVTFYVGIVSNPSFILQQDEIQNAEWLPFDEALKRLTYRETQDVFRKLMTALSSLLKFAANFG